jgi:hypothetical protein
MNIELIELPFDPFQERLKEPILKDRNGRIVYCVMCNKNPKPAVVMGRNRNLKPSEPLCREHDNINEGILREKLKRGELSPQ